jgi:AraC-like DNA-binding protein
MMPFYLKSASEKEAIIEILLKDQEQIAQLNEGLLPPYMHNILRSIIGIVYVSLMILQMLKATRERREEVLQTASFSWLKWFTGLMGMAVCSVFLILLLPQSPYFNKTLGIHLSVIICFVILNFYLFFRPQILYGIPRLRMKNLKLNGEHDVELDGKAIHEKAFQMVEENIDHSEELTGQTTLDYLLAYKPILELHLDLKKPYLQQGYNIGKLSSETGIPQHHLSALLNKVYGVRFNDFINQYRINHITAHFNQSGWNQMTLEGIASEVGFNSRTTFFNAIKKSSGLSPSEFINTIRSQKEQSKVPPTER